MAGTVSQCTFQCACLEFLQSIPCERLLLEADAPYVEKRRPTTPRDIPNQFIHFTCILNLSIVELLFLIIEMQK